MARKQTMKVYHGVPKSAVNEHTLLYTTLDGDIEPVIGNVLYKPNAIKFKQMPTGHGVINTGGITYGLNKTKTMYKSFSVDFWMDIREFRNTTVDYPEIITLQLSTVTNNARALKVYYSRVSDRIYCEIYNNTSYRALTIIPNIKSKNVPDYCHIRLDCVDGVFTPYYNGVKQPSLNLNEETTLRTYDSIIIHSDRLISDLHISNIDRGDYFPNLPQDFIEGKAVVKPRMGQQQIKGDPMYSQVTTVKIPPTHTSLSGWVDDPNWIPVTSQTALLRQNPEISTTNSNFHHAGSRFKIKGLGGEVIGGVIDTDTAVCRILEVTGDFSFRVDNASRLQVGDTFKMGDSRFYRSDNEPDRVITNINENIVTYTGVTLHINAFNDGWNLLFETTPSSSSPIVKTEDGANVNGTWSGLGTNEATFILGDNSNIEGKDLHVEYALTMPRGNSDFPEIPYKVDKAWGENGVEMTPVSEIVITDDFKGKITGNTKECSHVLKQGATKDTLADPVSNPLSEISTERYYQVSVKDGITRDYSVGLNRGAIPQYLISFNIIEIIEKKLGAEIPSKNKLTWIYNNVSVAVNVYARGTCPSGNYVQLNVYKAGVGWVDTISNSTNQILKMSWGNIISDGRVDSTGNIHFLVSTNACDGNTTSTIYLDYAIIHLALKTDSTFTTLYCDNKRAREDKCNPVLIQKETKTVKRYLPSTEYFVTECSYAKFTNEGIPNDLDVLANKHFNIAVDTSNYNKFVSNLNINLNQMPLEKAEHLYLPIDGRRILNSIPSHIGANITEIPFVHWWSDNGANIFAAPTTTNNFKTCVSDSNGVVKGQRGGYKDKNNNIIIYGDVDTSNMPSKDGLRLYDIAIVEKNKELMLYVIKASNGHKFYIYNDAITLIKIPNRPLIK